MYFKDFKMPKDVVLSTKTFVVSHLIILISALAFFGGVYYVLYPERFSAAVTEYLPVTKEPVSLFLEISSPEDDILVSDGNLVISGKSGPNATIIISGKDNDAGLQSDKNGEFSKVFPLSPGPNTIEIIAFDSEGNTKSAIKSVYYTDQIIE